MKQHLPALAGTLVVVSLTVAGCGAFGSGPVATPGSTARPASTSAVATAPAAPTAEPTATVDPIPPSSDPPATPAAPAAPAATVTTPVVPVTQFRSTRTGTNGDQVAAVLLGTSTRYDAVELVESDASAILAELGLGDTAAAAGSGRLILAPDAATVTRDLAKHRKRLAFLRAGDVSPAVRALAWDGTALFGSDRVRATADWPLLVDLPAAAGTATFDPAAAWTLFAAGDMMLDRGVYETVRVKKKGVDFPFDGGTAEITGRCKDCSPMGWDTPYTKRTGNAGAVRRVVSGADVALANFENPAPDRFRWHTRGTVFSADPRIIDGLAKGGLDVAGIANNHIGDAGRRGIVQTIANLTERGLKVAGAGKDLAAARKPAMMTFGDTQVAILAYDRIAPVYHAKADTAGSAGLTAKGAASDIRRARAAGADVVIVFPHWGIEYRGTPTSAQRDLAHAIIDAGADMIIGNHAHWAAAMEVYEGKPIWYALGNFIFDQTWSEPTMEGITLELTFDGADLAQVRMRPHIILDKAQPNFLDPAGSGKVVMDQVFRSSKGLLPW